MRFHILLLAYFMCLKDIKYGDCYINNTQERNTALQVHDVENVDGMVCFNWLYFMKLLPLFTDKIIKYNRLNQTYGNEYVQFVYEYKVIWEKFKDELRSYIMLAIPLDDTLTKPKLSHSTVQNWINTIETELENLQARISPVVQNIIWGKPIYIRDSDTQYFMQVSEKSRPYSSKLNRKMVLTTNATDYGVFSINPVLGGKYFQIRSVKTGQFLYHKMIKRVRKDHEIPEEHENVDERLKCIYKTGFTDLFSTYFQIELRGNDEVVIETFDRRPIYVLYNYNRTVAIPDKLYISRTTSKNKTAMFKLDAYNGPAIKSLSLVYSM